MQPSTPSRPRPVVGRVLLSAAFSVAWGCGGVDQTSVGAVVDAAVDVAPEAPAMEPSTSAPDAAPPPFEPPVYVLTSDARGEAGATGYLYAPGGIVQVR